MTTTNTIEVFQKAAELGLKLGFEPPDTLTLQPASRCPADFAQSLREHKPQLLALLRLPFVMVFSESLGETIFFCEDEDTKAALVQAGADEWSIYTRSELQSLCEQNRVAPLSATELKQLHQIKRTFNARIIIAQAQTALKAFAKVGVPGTRIGNSRLRRIGLTGWRRFCQTRHRSKKI